MTAPTTGLTPAEMLAACLARGANHYDPDDPNTFSTATGDDDGPPEPCIAAIDLEQMADKAEARETKWREAS